MSYEFSPIDFPDYGDLPYRQLRPLLMFNGQPPIGVLADVLRSTLNRKLRKRFDELTAPELITLMESYLELSHTREDVKSEYRSTGFDRG
jgi:hypothetical protein